MALSSAISASSCCSCGVRGSWRRGGSGFFSGWGAGRGSGFGAAGTSGAVGRATGSASSSSPGSNASSRPASASSSWPSTISPVGGSSFCTAGAAAGSSLSFSRWKSLPSRLPVLSFSSSRRFISSGTCATLVLKNVRNFSFCASISSCVSSLRLSSFGILVPPCSGHGGLAAVSYSAARWLWISYRMMPAATETLKLSTPVP